jgi:hypothetical protein
MKKGYHREKTRMSGFQLFLLFFSSIYYIFPVALILMDGKQLLEKQVVWDADIGYLSSLSFSLRDPLCCRKMEK